jgi:hypothetical protein
MSRVIQVLAIALTLGAAIAPSTGAATKPMSRLQQAQQDCLKVATQTKQDILLPRGVRAVCGLDVVPPSITPESKPVCIDGCPKGDFGQPTQGPEMEEHDTFSCDESVKLVSVEPFTFICDGKEIKLKKGRGVMILTPPYTPDNISSPAQEPIWGEIAK